MTIKHLVLPGGGAAGIRIVGALQYLHDNGVWNHTDLESIHCVSVGAIIAVLIALKFEWDVIVDYVVNRPWDDAYKVSLANIFDVFMKKGFFGPDMFITFFKPFFDSRDISLEITLAEFYALTGVSISFYTVELNSFVFTEISHETFPDLAVLTAVHMSAAYPILISPVIIEKSCYVDGGMLCNYPISRCLAKYPNVNEVLGIGGSSTSECKPITDDSSLFEYIMELIYSMISNLFDRVNEKENRVEIPNYVSIHIPSITLGDLQATFASIDIRNTVLEEGRVSAVESGLVPGNIP